MLSILNFRLSICITTTWRGIFTTLSGTMLTLVYIQCLSFNLLGVQVAVDWMTIPMKVSALRSGVGLKRFSPRVPVQTKTRA